MSKGDRLYKIFMTTMIVIIAGLLLACGVIAIQKSMKMKLSFPVTPNFLFEVYIQKEGSAMPEDSVFRNFEKSKDEGIVIQNGFSTLQSNTLSADGSFFTTYGDEFSIIIANYTTTMGVSVSVTSTAKLENGSAGVPAEITKVKSNAAPYDEETKIADEVKFKITNEAVFSQETFLEIKFSELNAYSVTFSEMNDCNVQDAPTEVKIGDNFTTTITPQTTFAANYFEYDITINGEPYTHYGHSGTLKIPAEDIVGDINISVNVYECWDGIIPDINSDEHDDFLRTFEEVNVKKTFTIDSPADLAKMIASVNAKPTTDFDSVFKELFDDEDGGMEYEEEVYEWLDNWVDSYQNVTFNLETDIYLNDEDFIYEEDTGFIYITDGVHEGRMKTGVTTNYSDAWTWVEGEEYDGILNTWESVYFDNSDGFTAILNGNNHFISGIYNGSLIGNLGTYIDFDYTGGDSVFRQGKVLNVDIVNGLAKSASITDYFMVGEIINCSNSAIVVSDNTWVGGIVGLAEQGLIKNCYNSGYIIGNDVVGGVIGASYTNGYVQNCLNTGKVFGKGGEYDAVCGIGSCVIENGFNIGEVLSEYACGVGAHHVYNSYFLQTDTINAGLEVYPGYTGNDSGTISSLKGAGSIIASLDIGNLDAAYIDGGLAYVDERSYTTFTNITIMEALNKAVELSGDSKYKYWGGTLDKPMFVDSNPYVS